MEGRRGKPRRGDVRGVFGKHKEEEEERIETRETLALRNKVESEKNLRGIRGIEGRSRNENVFARPNGPRENAETALSCR